MPYDDDDLDSVLFGSNDSPGGGSFDPFDPDLGEGEREALGDSFDLDPTDLRDFTLSLGRPIGDSTGGYLGVEPDDQRPLPWARYGDDNGADELRERERTDAGIANVRRVAAERSQRPTPGGTGVSEPPRLAGSIRVAQQRLATDFAATDADNANGAASAVVNGLIEQGRSTKRQYRTTGIVTPPQFTETVFEATVLKLASNVNGEWVLTLKIPPHDREHATVLGDAYGLALDVAIIRKKFGPNGDT